MRLRIRIDGEEHEVALEPGRVTVDGERFRARVEGVGPEFRVALGRRSRRVRVEGEAFVVDGEPLAARVVPLPPTAARGARPGALAGPVHPPLPGRIVAVRVEEGQAVSAGECLVVLEAMKMQNEVPAPADGEVLEVRVREGQLVEAGDVLVVLG